MNVKEEMAGYAFVRVAGRGAMSVVYEAVEKATGQRVAFKMLHVPANLSPAQQHSLIDRLAREARVMARLAHPNVVHILAVGEDEGEHYLVMEYLDGTTLRERLDSGPVPMPEAASILDQLGGAVDAVHAQGVVHRDLKPSNVMLLADGSVKLMDFGVARQGDDTTITETGMLVGSPAYMAPEQVRGEASAPSSDIWALGVLLYEMLAGRSPFGSSNVTTVLYRVAHEQPAPLTGGPGAVQKVIRRALDKNPAARYNSGCEMAAAFRAALAARPSKGGAIKVPVLPGARPARAAGASVVAMPDEARRGLVRAGILLASVALLVLLALAPFLIMRHSVHGTAERLPVRSPIAVAEPIADATAPQIQIREHAVQPPMHSVNERFMPHSTHVYKTVVTSPAKHPAAKASVHVAVRRPTAGRYLHRSYTPRRRRFAVRRYYVPVPRPRPQGWQNLERFIYHF